MEKDDQNPSQGLPEGSKSPLYGRAVAPALPAQLQNSPGYPDFVITLAYFIERFPITLADFVITLAYSNLM